MDPQFLPSAAQVVGVQPQTLGVPFPPHVLGLEQFPHWSVPPQPSGIEPQFLPAAWQVVGTQGVVPHRFAPAPPQNWPVGQLPQSVVPLQPSAIAPHSAPASSHVTSEAQLQCPALHVAGSWQVPQISVSPQPSSMVPHSTPSLSQVLASHPHALATPLPPQVLGASHAPQSSTLLQPSEARPHSAPKDAQERGMQDTEPHWLGPEPPQNRPSSHSPHFRMPPQPSSASPHSASSSAHVFFLQEPASLVPPPSGLVAFVLRSSREEDSVQAAMASAAAPCIAKSSSHFPGCVRFFSILV